MKLHGIVIQDTSIVIHNTLSSIMVGRKHNLKIAQNARDAFDATIAENIVRKIINKMSCT